MELIVWFSDSYVESISVRCLFFMRLLSYCKVDFKPRWVIMPEEVKCLHGELKQIPVLKNGETIYSACEIIQLCKESAAHHGLPLIPETNSLATRILFEWSTTNLVGLYTQLLCTEDQIKERIFKDYIKIYEGLTEEKLAVISTMMLTLNSQVEDISYLANQKKELALELLSGFDNHLKSSTYWLGDDVSIIDFSLFAFCYQLYNPQLCFFRDFIKESENLHPWMKRMDYLSRHEYAKMKV